MKKIIIVSALVLLWTAGANAQTAYDAAKLVSKRFKMEQLVLLVWEVQWEH